jgi:uncharacterized lipoprotein YajG
MFLFLRILKKTKNRELMKKLVIILSVCFVFCACASTKEINESQKVEFKVPDLPPNVHSNKYSQKRN